MEILYLLIPLSVVLVFLIGAVFWWSVRSGQFDDLEGPGYRVIMDDDHARPESAREGEVCQRADRESGSRNDKARDALK